jgi:hypothetical protein
LKQTAVGKIEQAGGTAHGFVFRCGIAEMNGQEPAVPFRENRAIGPVNIGQE